MRPGLGPGGPRMASRSKTCTTQACNGLTDAGGAGRRARVPSERLGARVGLTPSPDLAFAAVAFHRDGLATASARVGMHQVTGLNMRRLELDTLAWDRDDTSL